MIGDDTHAWRRRLPHLQREGKTYFITFRSVLRDLPPEARTIALEVCIHDHPEYYWLHTALIMPDHVHLLLDAVVSLSTLMYRIKSVSAHRINRCLGRSGPVWQREYFDHILRSDESLESKAEYIAQNPVRAGLVSRPEEYEWLWRAAAEE